MSHRFLCLQGHLWVDQEETGAPRALFCPTCGLRLHPEEELSLPKLPRLEDLTAPTPIPASDILWGSRGSADGGSAGPPLQPSDIEEIPGYELLGILGRGGMGIVFRARQVSLKRQVALKMILTGRHARPEERARFQREAEAVARLQHPNIVQIYEVGQQNGLPYFSLEFVNAGSLAQFLGGIPQAPAAAAGLVLHLAQAMHYAHQRGVVHRDLKPANILLHLDESRIRKDGRGADTAVFRELSAYVPKISDFGLAQHGDDRPRRHGSVVGTPSYMAPEQAQPHRGAVGPAADVYALGAILYESLTGRPPFTATTIAETAQQVLSQEPVPPTELQPKVPRDLETICLTCLQKDPANRYASAEALGEDLRRFLNHEPILARPTRLHERAVKWSRRHPVPTGALVGLVGVSALLVWSWGQLTVHLGEDLDGANRARAAAEARLADALEAIDGLAGLADRPAGSPPAEPRWRPDVQAEASRFYRQVIQDAGADPAGRALAARAHLHLGDAQRRGGDEAAARRSYQEAVGLLTALCDRDPGCESYRQLLARGRQRLQARHAASPAAP